MERIIEKKMESGACGKKNATKEVEEDIRRQKEKQGETRINQEK